MSQKWAMSFKKIYQVSKGAFRTQKNFIEFEKGF